MWNSIYRNDINFLRKVQKRRLFAFQGQYKLLILMRVYNKITYHLLKKNNLWTQIKIMQLMQVKVCQALGSYYYIQVTLLAPDFITCKNTVGKEKNREKIKEKGKSFHEILSKDFLCEYQQAMFSHPFLTKIHLKIHYMK